MNAIYELREGESRIKEKHAKGELPAELIPSEKIQKTATLAASMGTTLWFTRDELEKQNMLDVLIACGQFTMCWNLLEYIYNLKKDKSNTTAAHEAIIRCEESILDDWKKFQASPTWMVEQYNTKLKLEKSH